MQDILCFNVDTESDSGRPIAERYNVGGLPTLLVLEPDGSVRDQWSGYLPPDGFIPEIQRIQRNEGTLPAMRKAVETDPGNVDKRVAFARKLSEVGAGEELAGQLEVIRKAFDAELSENPDDLERRFEIAQSLESLGDSQGSAAQLAEIAKRDPEGTSLTSRRMRLAQLINGISRSPSPEAEDLEAFLEGETDPEILFRGHEFAGRIYAYLMRGAEGEDAAVLASKLLDSYRIAWKHRDQEMTSGLGNAMAWTLWLEREALGAEGKAFALTIATEAAKAAAGTAEEPSVLDTLACCQYMNGDTEAALETIERAIELAPDQAEYKESRELFRSKG